MHVHNSREVDSFNAQCSSFAAVAARQSWLECAIVSKIYKPFGFLFVDRVYIRLYKRVSVATGLFDGHSRRSLSASAAYVRHSLLLQLLHFFQQK